MEAGQIKLKPIAFTKKESHCTKVMIFVNHNTDIKTSYVAEIAVVLLRTIQNIKILCKQGPPSCDQLQEGVPGRHQKGQNHQVYQ